MTVLQALYQQAALRWALALGWSLTLSIILVQTVAQPLIPTGLPPGPPSWDRELFFSTMHILGFCILALLWYGALSLHIRTGYAQWITMLIGLLIGAGTEYAQGFTPDRNADPLDFLANVAGVALGLWLIRRSNRLSGSHKSTS